MRRPKNKYYFICGLIFLLVLSGCKVKRPSGVIPESQMEDLLYDYHIAKALGDNVSYNENYKKKLYIDYVFKKHKTTEAIFDSSLVWYTRNMEVLNSVYEKVNIRLRAQQDEINTLIAIRDNKPKTSIPGDSIDVWVWDRLYLLSGNPLTNKVSFTMPSDTNFKARDTLSWEVNYRFLPFDPDSTSAATMALQIQYINDSVISNVKEIMQSGVHTLRVQSDTLGDIKEIRGFIYYPSARDTARNLITTNVSLYRYHSNDTTFSIKKDSVEAITPIAEEQKPAVIPQQTEITPEATPVRRTDRPRPARDRMKETPQEPGEVR